MPSTLSGSGSKYVTERMIVIFGHSPTYGFLNFVQEYYFGMLSFRIIINSMQPSNFFLTLFKLIISIINVISRH